tara:strand:- start:202 stop:1728 length:1527 start_codon:yes stop_codon:yes gene_type:complete
MAKFNNHFLDINNKIIKTLPFLILFFYIFFAFKFNQYEIIFMDERIIIDDIYNVWLFDDTFNRFINIENNFYKKILIFLTEVSYGGDLRYGRLWSNIFTLIIGPFSLISDQATITAARILNILIFGYVFYFLSKTFLDEKYLWVSLVTFYSLPGVEYLNRFPKPETFALLFMAIGLYYLKNKKNYFSLASLSIATFLKINFIIVLFVVFLFIFKTSNNKLQLVYKSFFISLTSLIFVNPILLIPPINIFSFNLPNFYSKYITWLVSQGSYGQEKIFSISYSVFWSKTISAFYSIPSYLNFLFFLFLVVVVVLVTKKSFLKEDTYSLLFISIFIIYILFYMFLIERQFIWYINLPFIFLVLAIYRNLEKINLKDNLIIFFLMFISIFGLTNNLYEHNKEKAFTANHDYGYAGIVTVDEAIDGINKTVAEIKKIYTSNENLKFEIVYWDPNLFIPRNGVTYDEKFYIREYWDSREIIEILDYSDIYVTYENFQVDGINKKEIGNYILYYK